MTPLSRRLGATLALTAALLACSCNKSSDSENSEENVELLRISVPAAMNLNSVRPVGLTVEPDTGELFLLDAFLGLYRMLSDDTFEVAIDSFELYGQVQTASVFTDVAAMGNSLFALTARNDGFLLDLPARTIQQHFCYVPGGLPLPPPPPPGQPGPFPVEQHTDSVAWDPVSRRILAQPITMSGPTIMNSELGTFPETGGEGNDWHPMPTQDFLAGAMSVDTNGVIWLGRGNELFQYDLVRDELTRIRDLDAYGVEEISGMAFDAKYLWVLDAANEEIVRIPADLL